LEALRTSIESDQLDELPMMPAVAKSSYSHSMEQDERHHVPVEIARDWSDNATYCQCTIQ
jgi:hypothetical protein